MTLARSQMLLRSTCVASGQGKGREGRYELRKCIYINTEIISSEVLRSPHFTSWCCWPIRCYAAREHRFHQAAEYNQIQSMAVNRQCPSIGGK